MHELIFCFIAGMLLQRFGRMPENAPATLNSFIIHVSLPVDAVLSPPVKKSLATCC
jgi:hypothetical protein